MLSRTGEIAEQGSYEDLSSRENGYVQKLCGTRSSAHSTSSEYSDSSDDEMRLKAGQPTSTSVACQKVQISSADPSVEASSRQLGDTRVYWYYFRMTGLMNTAIFVVAELLFASLEYFPSVWLSWWADANVARPNHDVGYYLGVYAALQAAFLAALFFGARHVANTMVVQSGRQLHKQLLGTVMAAPLSFFSATDTGATLNRFSQDLQLVDAELPIALLLLGASAFGVIAQAVLVLVAAPYVGAAFALVVTVLYFVQCYYLRTSRQLRFLDLEAKSPLYSLFLESLQGRATIRAFHWQDEFKAEYLRALDASQRPIYLLYAAQQWLALVLGLITAAVAVILVALMVTLRNPTTNTGCGI